MPAFTVVVVRGYGTGLHIAGSWIRLWFITWTLVRVLSHYSLCTHKKPLQMQYAGTTLARRQSYARCTLITLLNRQAHVKMSI
jgi:hypothetical protein